jgi:hypothetical protein
MQVAGITTAVAGLTSEWEWLDGGRFEAFYSDRPPDIVLRVHAARSGLRVPVGDLVYSLEGFRSVYLAQDTWAFEYCPHNRSLFPQRPPHQLLVFDRGFTLGDLYVYPSEASERPTFKFGLFLFELFAGMLPFRNGMMVHACGVDDGGRGIVFAGHSGVGKSTMAGLWQERDGVRILHDDRIILRKKGGRWWVYPVPGIGEFRPSSPKGVPLESVFLVSHAAENRGRRKGVSGAATSLLAHVSLPPYDSGAVNVGLRLLEDLLGEVPIYELGFVPDEAVVDYVRDTLSQNHSSYGVRRETF